MSTPGRIEFSPRLDEAKFLRVTIDLGAGVSQTRTCTRTSVKLVMYRQMSQRCFGIASERRSYQLLLISTISISSESHGLGRINITVCCKNIIIGAL